MKRSYDRTTTYWPPLFWQTDGQIDSTIPLKLHYNRNFSPQVALNDAIYDVQQSLAVHLVLRLCLFFVIVLALIIAQQMVVRMRGSVYVFSV